MSMRWDKWGAGLFIRAGLLASLERREATRANILRILDYHRIGQPDAEAFRADPALFGATVAGFAEQMEYLAHHYSVVSLEQVLAALGRGRPLPPRSVLLTFDDGYRDFLECAWPVLRSLKLPAVLFVPTGYLSPEHRLFWWDKLYQSIYRTQCQELNVPPLGHWPLETRAQRDRAWARIKRRVSHLNHHEAMALVDRIVTALDITLLTCGGTLTWDEVRQMTEQGLYVAAHTVTHPILSRVSNEEARDEITGSQSAIRSQLGHAWPVFAYPVGHRADLRPELVSILRQEGFQMAVTMIEGHNALGSSDPLSLKRVGMAPHLSLDEFRLVLTSAYNWYGTVAQLATSVSGSW
jgi:peptidoglycan/xylan/chitin deacetylase (PgdA/CDA1 family)